MLVRLVDKHRRAVSVIKTALLGVGISGRSICIQTDSWSYGVGDNRNETKFAVFVSAPAGENKEPSLETGKTLVEAVKNTIISIKGGKNKSSAKLEDQSKVAPF